MKRATQTMLYHLLPVVLGLLAIGGSAIPAIIAFVLHSALSPNYLWGFLVAVIAMFCVFLVLRIERHTSSVEQCFQVAVLLSIASYWLPTVLLLLLPIGGYLIYQNLFNLRSLTAMLLGVALVAVWAAVAVYMGWIANTWAAFFDPKNAWGWIPTGAALIAYITSTIVRQILRVR